KGPGFGVLATVLGQAIADVDAADGRTCGIAVLDGRHIEEIEAFHVLDILGQRRRELAFLHPPRAERHHADLALRKELSASRISMRPECSLLEDGVVEETFPSLHGRDEF